MPIDVRPWCSEDENTEPPPPKTGREAPLNPKK
jgi:hypothetical protein